MAKTGRNTFLLGRFKLVYTSV